MDDGEVDFANQFLNNELEEFLSSTSTCTHTHTCNPPGPNAMGHTHTCHHTHTRLFTSGEEEEENEQKPKRSRKPLGNREAVRKYREKKKAHTAYLEEEVKKLRTLNQQLIRKLQGQAALQAEVLRLHMLLADLRGKIDGELGVFPFQKQCNSASFQCDASVPCVGANAMMVGWEGNCEPPIIHCQNGNIVQNVEIDGAKSMPVRRSLVSSGSQGE